MHFRVVPLPRTIRDIDKGPDRGTAVSIVIGERCTTAVRLFGKHRRDVFSSLIVSSTAGPEARFLHGRFVMGELGCGGVDGVKG